jgi:hypothetical protein
MDRPLDEVMIEGIDRFLLRKTDQQQAIRRAAWTAALADAGGLQGKALIVRREKLPSQAEDYARTRKLDVVLADQLHLQLPRLLSK